MATKYENNVSLASSRIVALVCRRSGVRSPEQAILTLDSIPYIPHLPISLRAALFHQQSSQIDRILALMAFRTDMPAR
jgi:hypothetical protein